MASLRQKWLIKNFDKKYPSAARTRWTNAEDIQLMNEMNLDMSIERIAEIHKRTIWSIKCRLQDFSQKSLIARKIEFPDDDFRADIKRIRECVELLVEMMIKK